MWSDDWVAPHMLNGSCFTFIRGARIGVYTPTWDTASAGIPLMLYDGQNHYIYGPGGIPVEQFTAQPFYFHLDQIGSVRVITGSNAAIVGGLDYDPYGKPVDNTKSQAAHQITPLGYPGQFTDQENGLLYLRARWYDPTTGQFLTIDPALITTHQPYTYTDDNPLNATDPTGLCVRGFGAVCGTWNHTGGAAIHWATHRTIGWCLTGSAGFGVGVGASGCIALVGGHPTLLGSLAAGSSTPDASFMTGPLLSNAHHVSQLRGYFHEAGGSASAFGVNAGDNHSWGHDACGNYIWENQFGLGGSLLPFSASGHYGDSYTGAHSW
jgi:RHS repeat-associated protein